MGEKCYEYIKLFENAFKDHLSVKYALATSSYTGALHMGFMHLILGSEMKLYWQTQIG